jgi:cytochrome c oxidase subunit II
LLAVLVLMLIAACVAAGLAARRSFGGNGPGSPPDTATYPASTDPPDLGEPIYRRHCAGCHSSDGSSGVGPSLLGLSSSDVTMNDGETIVADEDYLRESIRDPRARVRDGYPSIMPSYGNLRDEEVDALTAFIRSLR